LVQPASRRRLKEESQLRREGEKRKEKGRGKKRTVHGRSVDDLRLELLTIRRLSL
jgi:hypothetical protein